MSATIVSLPGRRLEPSDVVPLQVTLDLNSYNKLVALARRHWDGDVATAAADMLAHAVEDCSPRRRR